jgi:hypothetical protein
MFRLRGIYLEGYWDVGWRKGLTLRIAAFAEAMMRQAGLRHSAKPVALHVTTNLLIPFADGEVYSRTQSNRVFVSSVLCLCITSTKNYINHITRHPVAHITHKDGID